MTYSVSAEEGPDGSLITDPKSTSGILPNELNTSFFCVFKTAITATQFPHTTICHKNQMHTQ